MNGISKGATILLGGLIAITILSTLVSKNSNTSSVINSGGGAISNTLSAARGGN